MIMQRSCIADVFKWCHLCVHCRVCPPPCLLRLVCLDLRLVCHYWQSSTVGFVNRLLVSHEPQGKLSKTIADVYVEFT